MMAEPMLRLRCADCGKQFVVDEPDVEGQLLTCPHCEADVDLDAEEEDQDDEEG